jgi:hypothetical protein
MKTLAFPVLLLCLCASAHSQQPQIQVAIQPGVCKQITNCALYDENGAFPGVWVNTNPGNFVQTPETGRCDDITSYQFHTDGHPLKKNGDRAVFDLTVTCDGVNEFGDYTLTVHESGYAYYSTGGGGRGGAPSGVRYFVQSGTKTIQ